MTRDPAPARCSLDEPAVASALRELHSAARADRGRFLRLVPRLAFGTLRGRTFAQAISPAAMKDCFLAVPPDEGRFLYLTARSLGARRIVEFGTSFGISTLYLAAAVRDNGGGLVIGTEIEPVKHAAAQSNLERAGLGDLVDLRLGDALETLRETGAPLDLVFLDGWKDLYLPVLEMLRPRLRPAAVVLADNIRTFRKELRPYVEAVQSGRLGFVSATLPISDGLEYSVYAPA